MPPGSVFGVIEIPNKKLKKFKLSENFFGNENPNFEIIISDYEFKENGININKISGETQLISYDLFPKNYSQNDLKKNLLKIESSFLEQIILEEICLEDWCWVQEFR